MCACILCVPFHRQVTCVLYSDFSSFYVGYSPRGFTHGGHILRSGTRTFLTVLLFYSTVCLTAFTDFAVRGHGVASCLFLAPYCLPH